LGIQSLEDFAKSNFWQKKEEKSTEITKNYAISKVAQSNLGTIVTEPLRELCEL